MEYNRKGFFDAKVVIALFIIVAGALMLLDNFGYYIHFHIWDWWPLILVIIGAGQLLQPKESRQVLSGGLLILVGLLFLGDNLRLFLFGFWDIWPLLLIFIGIMILRNHVWKKKTEHDDASHINQFFVLGGGDHSYSSHKLESGSLFAFMGGGSIDLREATMAEDNMEIEVFVMMGGIDILVPRNWRVRFQGMPIMGGVENKTSTAIVKENGVEPAKADKEIIIKGVVIMGGLEIKN